jgi:hypothetical protein
MHLKEFLDRHLQLLLFPDYLCLIHGRSGVTRFRIFGVFGTSAILPRIFILTARRVQYSMICRLNCYKYHDKPSRLHMQVLPCVPSDPRPIAQLEETTSFSSAHDNRK